MLQAGFATRTEVEAIVDELYRLGSDEDRRDGLKARRGERLMRATT